MTVLIRHCVAAALARALARRPWPAATTTTPPNDDRRQGPGLFRLRARHTAARRCPTRASCCSRRAASRWCSSPTCSGSTAATSARMSARTTSRCPATRPATSRSSVARRNRARLERHEHRDQLHAAAAVDVHVRAPAVAVCCRWLLAALALARARSAQPADTILLNGKIVTLRRARPAEALAVRGGRIAAVGRSADIRALAGPATRVIDLAGRTVIPGLIDSHIHAIRAGLTYTTEVHWIGARSLAEALDRIRATRRRPRRRAPGWSSPAAGPSGSSPKAAARPRPRSPPPRPTITSMCSFSTAPCCCRPAGSRRSASPNDAELASRLKIETGADGKPTGWLAGDNRTISDLFDLLPRPSFAQQVAGTRAFFRTLNSLGITGVLDPGGYNMPIEAYRRAVPGLARPRADRARRLQPVRAAPRPRARGFPGADRDAADGLRRRLAALQRHRRERHLGHVQQRHADRGAEGAALPGAALGGAARPDRDLPLAQRPLGASSARRAGAGEPRDAGRAAALVDRASQRRARRKASRA